MEGGGNFSVKEGKLRGANYHKPAAKGGGNCQCAMGDEKELSEGASGPLVSNGVGQLNVYVSSQKCFHEPREMKEPTR